MEPKPLCDQHKLRNKYPEEERKAQSCAPSAVVGLMRLNKGQLEEKLRATNYEASDHVFATGKGTPLDAQNMINRHFKPLLNRAELPSIRWHTLRHTCFTILLARGMHPKYVQHLGGHAPCSSPSTDTPTGCPLWAATQPKGWMRPWARRSGR